MSDPGLRERKKRATARDLALASYELVLERGFDAVTVDDVVERAGYSRRTFANYYTCKQEAVVDGFTLRMRLLATGHADPGPPPRGSLESLIDTIQAQVTTLFTGPALAEIRDFSAILRTDRSLTPYLSQAFERDFDAALSLRVTQDLGIETSTLLLGAIVGQMLALMRLITGTGDACAPGRPDPDVTGTVPVDPDRVSRLIVEAFDHVRHGFLPTPT